MDASTFVAGSLSLELVNTINNWHEPRHDALGQPGSATTWASVALEEEIGLIGEAGLRDLRALRHHVRQAFGAIASATDPGPEDVARLKDTYRRGLATARIVRAGEVYRVTWTDLTADVAAPFAADAMQLLLRGPLDRVGECPRCGWLFLDTSKNARRVWCSMRTCGAREKAKRHYRRAHPES